MSKRTGKWGGKAIIIYSNFQKKLLFSLLVQHFKDLEKRKLDKISIFIFNREKMLFEVSNLPYSGEKCHPIFNRQFHVSPRVG